MKTNSTLQLFLILLLLSSTSLSAQEFINPISIPPLILYNTEGGYDLDVIQTEHNFSPMSMTDTLNTMVTTFAFEDFNNPGTTSILGPTISWEYGDSLEVSVLNELSENTTTHWHGAHVPQAADGGPHQLILPNELWGPPTFEVKDKSATMWYHPHAMDLTYRQVQMGLSGMIYVQDPDNDLILSVIHEILPTDYSVNDFPLIFQTKKFKRNGTGDIEIQADQGYKDDYTYMVNGIVDPFLNAPASMIRLRILNGDGKFSFNFNFTFENGNPFPSHLIATDAGYTTRTFEINKILMAPGERTEFLLDLRGLEGEAIYIKNLVSEIPAGVIGNSSTTDNYATDRNLLKIVIGAPAGPPSPIIAFPINLHPSEAPAMSEVSKTRVKTFRQDMFDVSTKPLFNIDSMLMDMMVVNDVVKLDSTEIWTIKNTTGIAHPWHIHDIHFWVTEILENGVALDKTLYPQIFDGPKDNVLVMPGWELSYIATFDDFGTEIMPNNSYMYHCHILPHEDNGMMGQFVVWNGLGNPNTSTEDPALSDRSMTLYPNPTQGLLYLEGASEEKSILRISDLQGRLLSLLTLPRFDGNIGINVSSLPKGMVILEWLSQEGKAVSKVVIE